MSDKSKILLNTMLNVIQKEKATFLRRLSCGTRRGRLSFKNKDLAAGNYEVSNLNGGPAGESGIDTK